MGYTFTMRIEFITWLIDQMNRRGWNNSELARRAGIGPSGISMIINEQRAPGVDFCRAVARALGLPPETVFRQAGLLPPDVNSDAPARRELLYLFEQLPESDRGLVLSMVRAVVCERAPKYQTGEDE